MLDDLGREYPSHRLIGSLLQCSEDILLDTVEALLSGPGQHGFRNINPLGLFTFILQKFQKFSTPAAQIQYVIGMDEMLQIDLQIFLNGGFITPETVFEIRVLER